MMAVRNNSVKIVSYLLMKGAEYDHVDSSDNSSLHYAAAYGFHECIKLLVQAGANINAQNSWNLTPLSVGLMKCHSRCVKQLLEYKDINVNCQDDQGKSLLYLETETFFEDFEEKYKKIKYWMDKGADPNVCDIEGNIPLHFCGQNHTYAIRQCSQQDDEYPPNYMNSLHLPGLNKLLTKEQERDNKLFEYYREKAEELAKKDENWPKMEIEVLNDVEKLSLIKKYYEKIVNEKREALYKTYHENSIQKLTKLFLEYKSDVNKVNSSNETPIIMSLKQGQYEVFEILMNDENTDIKKGFGEDGIYHVLAQYLNSQYVYDVFDKVLESHGDLDGALGKYNEDGYTPLHYIILSNNIGENMFGNFEKLVRKMKEKGADVNAVVIEKFKFRKGNEAVLKQEKRINIQKLKSEQMI